MFLSSRSLVETQDSGLQGPDNPKVEPPARVPGMMFGGHGLLPKANLGGIQIYYLTRGGQKSPATSGGIVGYRKGIRGPGGLESGLGQSHEAVPVREEFRRRFARLSDIADPGALGFSG